MQKETLSKPSRIKPFWDAKTPGMLRARIEVKEQLLKQCHIESQEFWRINQQIAELSRELNEQERKAIA